MERKIGEIFEYNGEWYQTVKPQGKCCSCDLFIDGHCVSDFSLNGSCFYCHRKDGEDVMFKKLEKAEEPIIAKGRTFQRFICFDISCEGCIFNTDKNACDKYHYIDGPCPDNEIWVEIKQNKEDMEEKEQKWGVSSDTINEINKGIEPMNTSRNIDTERSGAEGIRRNLKPFNLEAARSGKPVCTRNGRKARIICFDAKGNKPLIILSEIDGKEVILRYTEKGQSDNFHSPTPREDDLMMLPEKKEGWVNVYKDSVYDTKDEALIGRSESRGYIDTIKINWSE